MPELKRRYHQRCAGFPPVLTARCAFAARAGIWSCLALATGLAAVPTLTHAQATTDTPLFLRGTAGSGVTAIAQNTEPSTSSPPEPQRQEQDRSSRVQRVGNADQLATAAAPLTVTPALRQNLRAAPASGGQPNLREAEPFSPIGLRLGSWIAFLDAEQTIGYSTNLDAAFEGEAGAFSQTSASVNLQSDWSRHQANLSAGGTLRRDFVSGTETIPTANLDAGLRLDLAGGYIAEGDLSYRYATESATADTITDAADGRTGFHTASASALLAKRDTRLQFAIRGVAQRTVFEDIDLIAGGSTSQDDRNNNEYTAIARVGYEVSPAITPFVEGEIARTEFDQERDRNGEERSSTTYAARVGVEVDLREKLQGELAVGYRSEAFDDPGLDALEGFTIDGNIAWSPVRGTVVNLSSNTAFQGSTTAGDSGSVLQTFAARIERRINDRLTIGADASWSIERPNDGGETQNTAGLAFTFDYWINRYLALTGSLESEHQPSFEIGTGYQANTVRAGLRFQR